VWFTWDLVSRIGVKSLRVYQQVQEALQERIALQRSKSGLNGDQAAGKLAFGCTDVKALTPKSASARRHLTL
jgi:hypothetical protein